MASFSKKKKKKKKKRKKREREREISTIAILDGVRHAATAIEKGTLG